MPSLKEPPVDHGRDDKKPVDPQLTGPTNSEETIAACFQKANKKIIIAESGWNIHSTDVKKDPAKNLLTPNKKKPQKVTLKNKDRGKKPVKSTHVTTVGPKCQSSAMKKPNKLGLRGGMYGPGRGRGQQSSSDATQGHIDHDFIDLCRLNPPTNESVPDDENPPSNNRFAELMETEIDEEEKTNETTGTNLSHNDEAVRDIDAKANDSSDNTTNLAQLQEELAQADTEANQAAEKEDNLYANLEQENYYDNNQDPQETQEPMENEIKESKITLSPGDSDDDYHCEDDDHNTKNKNAKPNPAQKMAPPKHTATIDTYFGYGSNKADSSLHKLANTKLLLVTPQDRIKSIARMPSAINSNDTSGSDSGSDSDNANICSDDVPADIINNAHTNPDAKPAAVHNNKWTTHTYNKKDASPAVRPSLKNRAVDIRMEHMCKYVWHYDVIIKTAASKNPPVEVRDKFLHIFEQLQEADPSIILIPYKSINYSERAIAKPQSFPEKMTQIKKYLDSIMLREQGGNVFVKCLLAHNAEFEDIRTDSLYTLQPEGHRIYKRQLPVEKMEYAGYFLFSVRTQNLEDLKTVFWKKFKIDMALRWTTMQTEEKYIQYEDRTKAPSAIQILVSSNDVQRTKKLLRQEYKTSKTTGYIEGQKMRYIPDRKLLICSDTKAKLQDAALRQLVFTTAIKSLYSQSILQLNKKYPPTDQTLREIILTIPSKNKGMIFHSVNKTWNDPSRTVLTCLPHNLEEAQDTINALIPRLRYEYGNDILKFFHPDAVTATAEVTWDPRCKVATSPADEAFDEVLAVDEEYNFVQIDTEGTLKETLEQFNIGTTEYGNGSLGTFGTQTISEKTVVA